MAGFVTGTNEHLIRANLWANRLKDVLDDELMFQRYIDWITDFPDGDTINIPSIGQMETLDYEEGGQIQYTSMDTGNFTFSINQYKSAATYISQKMKQNSMYMSRIVSAFVPKMQRALMEAVEVRALAVGPEGQTASSLNTINGGDHRFVAGGTGQRIAVTDFARAKYALQKANVPSRNLVAIVDPSVGYELETQTNLVNLSNNPRWEGIIATGAMTGMHFIKNVFGFDVYVSQNLKASTGETIDSVAVNSSGVHNLFFSAESDVLPIVGNIRQQPQVWSEFNKDLQREEYVTTMRYDFKLYRPENLVTILSATDQVGVSS